MHVRAGFDRQTVVDVRPAVRRAHALDRDDTIAAARQHRAGHDFEARFDSGQGERRVSRGLDAGDPEASPPAAPCIRSEGDAVHGHAVERRLVAFGPHGLREHRTRE